MTRTISFLLGAFLLTAAALPSTKTIPSHSGYLASGYLASGYPISGTVESTEGLPIAYAYLLDAKGEDTVSTTDVLGQFFLQADRSLLNVRIVAAGYETATATLKAEQHHRLLLQKAKVVAVPSSGDSLAETAIRGIRTSSKKSKGDSAHFEDSFSSEALLRSTDLSMGMATAPVMARSASEESTGRAPAVSHKKESDVAASSVLGTTSPMASSKAKANAPAPGQLTAGEINDFSKWELWEDIHQEDLAEYQQVWQLYPSQRYTVQLQYPNGQAATNITVQLANQQGQVLWSAKTDNLGRAELWRDLVKTQAATKSSLQIQLVQNGKKLRLPTAYPIQEGINHFTLAGDCQQPKAVDIAFVVDATGSMGDELSYLASELTDVLKRAADTLQGQSLRLATVFYRDHGDEYLTHHADFSEQVGDMVTFLGEQSANGGGDTPEAVEEALAVALHQLSWRKEAASRLLFLVLDAPPHQEAENVQRLQALTALAASSGVRIIPVVCSGMDKSGEYLLRSLALATNGTYTFLTDHSGIGGKHLEPSTDDYAVEKLNDLLLRLIHQFSKVQDCEDPEVLALPSRIRPSSNPDWSIFPNPTAAVANLRLARAAGMLFLLDSNGKLLERFQVNQVEMALPLQQYPAGTYFIRYQWETENSIQRVIKLTLT